MVGFKSPQLESAALCCVVWSALAFATGQNSSDLESRLRAFTPPSVVRTAEEVGDGHGNPLPIEIDFIRGDFARTGNFDFVVASYQTGFGGTIRLFREVEGNLVVAADFPQPTDVGGARTRLELVDVDNDGHPEVAAHVSGATAGEGLSVIQEAGGGLRLLTRDESGVTFLPGGEFADLDDDGVLEIVTPSSDIGDNPDSPSLVKVPFQVYKFNGTEFVLHSTPATDPTGFLTADLQTQSVSIGRALLRPATVPLARIQQGGTADEQGKFNVRIGNLTSSLPSNPGPRNVQDVDLASLILGRNLRSLRTLILTPEGDDADEETESGFIGPYLRAEFAANDVLAYLPRTQLTKPLEVGDALTLDIRAKMKDGAPVFGSVVVRIVGDATAND